MSLEVKLCLRWLLVNLKNHVRQADEFGDMDHERAIKNRHIINKTAVSLPETF